MQVRIKTDLINEPVSLEEVRNFIKFDETDDTEDVLISNMISSARNYIEKNTGLALVKKTFEALFSYDEIFILPAFPIISITSVKTIDVEGTETDLTLNTDYYVKGLMEKEIIYDLSSYYQLKVEFTAGYGESETETLPDDLRHAILVQIAKWYDNRDDFYENNVLGIVKKVITDHKRFVI